MYALRFVVAALVATVAALAQDVRYADPAGRFSFSYSSRWSVQETPAGVVATAPDRRASFAVTPTNTADGISLREVADGHLEMVRRSRPGLTVEVVEEGARRVGMFDGYRRVLRVRDPRAGAVYLEAVFVRTPASGLMVTASCPEAARADLAPQFAAMLDSVGAREPAGDDRRAAIERKLHALDQARDAGVLTADEHARKRAELETALRDLQPRPDPERERKLEALDAAHAAGVLDDEEYARKRAELLGPRAGGPAAGEAGTPVPELGQKGALYRHPIGFSLWHPAGWKVQEHDDFLQLVPPDPAMSADGPLELYFVIGDSVEGSGIDRPDHPEVLAYLDQQVKSIVATLERTSAPRPIETTAGKGSAIDWTCVAPDGHKVLARCYVSIVEQNGVALLALGLPEKLAPRESEVRSIFASFGFGEGARDAALVGRWRLTSTTSLRNESPWESDWSRASAVGETQSRITFSADGTFERVDEWHMIAMGAGVSLEDRDRKVGRGKWCAGDGALYLISDEQTWTDYRYRIERTAAGSRLRLANGNRGENWEPAK